MKILSLFIGLIFFSTISLGTTPDFETAVVKKLEKRFEPQKVIQRFAKVSGKNKICRSEVKMLTRTAYAYILSQNLINKTKNIRNRSLKDEGSDPIGFLIIKNLFSRLTPEQKTAIKRLKISYLSKLDEARDYLSGDERQAIEFANFLLERIDLEEGKDFSCENQNIVLSGL